MRGQKSDTGRTVTKDGYVNVRLPDGRWVGEHRVVMERELGRALLPGERVRHINGDHADNRPANLELRVARRAVDVDRSVDEVIALLVERYPERVRAALDGRTLHP